MREMRKNCRKSWKTLERLIKDWWETAERLLLACAVECWNKQTKNSLSWTPVGAKIFRSVEYHAEGKPHSYAEPTIYRSSWQFCTALGQNWLYISRWEGILSGRFTGLRGANDLRKIPYIKPIKVKGLPKWWSKSFCLLLLKYGNQWLFFPSVVHLIKYVSQAIVSSKIWEAQFINWTKFCKTPLI